MLHSQCSTAEGCRRAWTGSSGPQARHLQGSQVVLAAAMKSAGSEDFTPCVVVPFALLPLHVFVVFCIVLP